MKKLQFSFLTTILILLLGNDISAQEFGLDWVKQMGGMEDDGGREMALDDLGNVYILGYFNGTVDLDPGPDTRIFSSIGGQDIFIQKLDPSGGLIWVKQVAGMEDQVGRAITVDDLGNVYTSGFFSGTADFDPGSETLNFSATGNTDIFILKLDSSGNLAWAKHMGGVNANIGGYAIAVDNLGSVYTTGTFNGTIDFDPDFGIFNLTPFGNRDVFIQKLSTSTGKFLWAKQMGGSIDEGGYGIVTDALGNVFTAGDFSGTVDFDPGPGTLNLSTAGGGDIFIQKLNASGKLQWVKQIGGPSIDGIEAIALDDLGNIYTTGEFRGIVDFDPGPGTLNLNSAGGNDVFIQKLDASGDLLWAKQMGGPQDEQVFDIAIDNLGNVYTTGGFHAIADFDPGVETFDLMAVDGFDIFIQKLDASGDLAWAKQMGGTEDDGGLGIGIDALGNVYTTGIFRENSDFDPGAETLELISAGGWDIFVMKLSELVVDIDKVENNLGILAYPNPTSHLLDIDKGINPEINILLSDNLGRTLISKNSTDQITSLDLSHYASGFYFLSIDNNENTTTRKIVLNRY